jgi:hypothetical protein
MYIYAEIVYSFLTVRIIAYLSAMESSLRVMQFSPPASSIVGDKRLWDITDKFRHVASGQ